MYPVPVGLLPQPRLLAVPHSTVTDGLSGDVPGRAYVRLLSGSRTPGHDRLRLPIVLGSSSSSSSLPLSISPSLYLPASTLFFSLPAGASTSFHGCSRALSDFPLASASATPCRPRLCSRPRLRPHRPWLLLLQRPSPSLLSSGPSRNTLDLSPEAPDFTEVLAPASAPAPLRLGQLPFWLQLRYKPASIPESSAPATFFFTTWAALGSSPVSALALPRRPRPPRVGFPLPASASASPRRLRFTSRQPRSSTREKERSGATE